MAQSNPEFLNFDGIGTSDSSGASQHIPIQALKSSQKTPKWKKAVMNSLERIGLEQLRHNIRFSAYRSMIAGNYLAGYSGLEDNPDFAMPWFDKEVRSLREKQNIPTYIKHFDFMGIIINAITSIYTELDDRYRVESLDEYATNEYIRQKTEMLHQYAQQTFKAEIDRMLLARGVDPNKQDFETEQEQQAYQQELQNQVKALTPPEIEKNLSKNFKILATEWAQNTLTEDKKLFYLNDMDREDFINVCLSGRFFRHYRVGYDSYTIESWLPEETFFSQDVHTKFPQDGEYVGRITQMSVSDILNKYGHLMSYNQQDAIGNYWNQKKDWTGLNGLQIENKGGIAPKDAVFPEPVQVPFHNYFDHQVNLQMESAFNKPAGITTDAEGNETETWLPREENDLDDGAGYEDYSHILRDDIDVRNDTIRVVEAYWRSYKRMGVLIYESDLGGVALELTTDDLLPDFLREKEIKTARNISLQELQKALREDRLNEYVNTITYTYVPEVWKGIKIRKNGSTLKEDLFLDVNPLEYQIKGGLSNIYDVKLPVSGLIDGAAAIAPIVAPYQQLHNICMNQNTELLEKELGVFFTFDITGLPSEYQDESTEESILRMRDGIRDSGLLALDLSRQNTQGNNPNVFQRQEIVYATQVQYRWDMAQRYKQEAFGQVGITPQILGQPNTYTTAEGVKQGAQASYALINHRFEKMFTAKAKGMDIQLAVAQYCEVNGKDATLLTRGSDGTHNYLNIIENDPEFSIRSLGVQSQATVSDRKVVEQIRQFLIQNNTIDRSDSDMIELLTNPVLVELQQIAKDIDVKQQKKVLEERQFDSQQLQAQLDANAKEQEAERQHDLKKDDLNNRAKIKVALINGESKLGDDNANADYADILQQTAKDALQDTYDKANLSLKQEDLNRKSQTDSNHNARELQKLSLKAQEIALQKKKIENDKYIATINKN